MINWKRKDFDSPPTSLANKVRQNAQKLAEDNKDGDYIKSNHYATPEVVSLLKAYSIDKETFDENSDLAKCYYCESTSEVVAALQVEHYRPKKTIHDDNRKIVPNTSGYYWLALEWTNLIYACSKCNGRGGKGNIFTIRGSRASIGTALNSSSDFDRTHCYSNKDPSRSERPNLLHPEIDNSYK